MKAVTISWRILLLAAALTLAMGCATLADNQLAAPEVDAPSSVVRGEIFTIVPSEVPNAVNYDLHIINTHGSNDQNNWTWINRVDHDGVGPLSQGTSNLEPGEYLWWCGVAADGFGGACTTGTFTVEPGPGGLYLSKTQVEVGEDLAVSVYDPGAERIRVTGGYDWLDKDGWETDNWVRNNMGWGDCPDHVTIRAEGMHGGKWRLIDEIPVEIVASNGNMPEPEVTLMSAYSTGEDVGFTVALPEYATSCDIEVYRMHDHHIVLSEGWLQNTVLNITLSSGNLEAGDVYVARILVRGYGYRCFDGEYPFVITDGSQSQGITLDIPQEIHMGQHLETKVFADGAEEVMIWTSAFGRQWLNGNNYDDREGCFKAGFEINIYSGYTGEQTVQFYAVAKTNGQWDRTTTVQTVTVAANHGPADSPTFTISKSQLKRGEMLLASVNPVSQPGGKYHVNVFDMNDNWAADFAGGESGEVYASTANLAPGQYRIHAYVRVMDYLVGHSEQDFFFTVEDEPSNGMGSLYVTPTQVETYQCPLFSLYAKGADEVVLCITGDSNDIVAGSNHWDGDGNLSDNRFINWRSFDWPDTYYAYMAARFGSEWRVVGGVTEISVTAPNGESPVPSADCASIMVLGDDYSFTVTPADGVEYNLRIERRDEWDQNKCLTDTENNDIYRNWNGAHTFTFAASQFRPGIYTVRIWSGRRNVGFATSYREYDLVCAEDPISDIISLVLDNESPLVNTPIHITVNAPGAEEIRIYNQNGKIDWRGGNHFEFDTGVPNGDRFYYARAKINGQWYISDVKEIHWIEYAQCPQAPLTVDRQVARGGMFTVTIGETPEANVFHLHIVEKNNPEHELYFQQFSVPGSYLIPSANLPAGQYSVYMSNGGPGYGWIDQGPQENNVLTVTQASAGLYLSKTRVEVGENLIVSVYDPGAERIRVTGGYDWLDENGWDVDSWYTNNMGWGNCPDHVTIRAEGMHGGKWRLIDEIPVEIVASNGNMPEPEVTVMSAYSAGLDVNFRVITPDDATSVDVEVYKVDGHNTILKEEWIQNTNTHITLAANDLEAGQTYAVRTLVRGYGYRCYEGEKLFVITVPYDQNLNISVNDSYDDCSIKVNVGYTVKARAKDATAIRVYDGQGWRYYLGGSMEEVWCESHKGLRIFYVQAYYGQVDSGRYHQGDIDYMRNLAWSQEGMSNMIRVNITAIGQAPKPEYVLDSRIVYRGDQLVLTLNNMDERQTYKAHVWRDLNGSDLWYEPNYHPVGNTICVETDYIEPGVLLVWVDAEGREDYENNSTSQVFVVIDSNRVFTLPNMLTTIEPEAFVGTNAQLVIVPNGVQSIGSRAFADSSVIAAVIPDGVEVSGDAFPEGTFKFNGN